MNWMAIVGLIMQVLEAIAQLKKTPATEEAAANLPILADILAILPKLVVILPDVTAIFSAFTNNAGWPAILTALQKLLTDAQGATT